VKCGTIANDDRDELEDIDGYQRVVVIGRHVDKCPEDYFLREVEMPPESQI
jgi:hypothetical protein